MCTQEVHCCWSITSAKTFTVVVEHKRSCSTVPTKDHGRRYVPPHRPTSKPPSPFLFCTLYPHIKTHPRRAYAKQSLLPCTHTKPHPRHAYAQHKPPLKKNSLQLCFTTLYPHQAPHQAPPATQAYAQHKPRYTTATKMPPPSFLLSTIPRARRRRRRHRLLPPLSGASFNEQES